MISKPAHTFVSLFCGCGGFDLGFVQAGFHCLGAFDIDEDAVSTYRRNFGECAQILDLSQTLPRLPAKAIDVLIAGTPCQGFSTIGKRSLEDPRNALLVRAATIAVRLNPRIIVLENVKGAVSGGHRAYWEQATEILAAKSFKVAEIECDASEYGVPQVRRRMLAIAWRTSVEVSPVLPKVPGGTLGDALANVEKVPDHNPNTLDPQSVPARIAQYIGPGQKLCNVRSSERSVHTWNVPEIYGATTKSERVVLEALLRRRRQKRRRDFGDADPVTARDLYVMLRRPVATTLQSLVRKRYVRKIGVYYDLVHTFNGKFRRLQLEQPSPTVDSHFGDPHYFLHPTQHRSFSVREAARVQGFPDSFVFEGAERSQYRMIGNAVPPPLAKVLAQYISSTFL